MSKVVLYCNISCPFARRGMLGARFKGVAADERTIPLSGHLTAMAQGEAHPALHDTLYGDASLASLQATKAAYRADINPAGAVPTLVHTVAGTDHIVPEAEVVAEYFEDAFPDSGVSLMPKEAHLRARVRQWLKVLGGEQGVNGYYGCLMNQDPAKDEKYRTNIHKGFATFAKLASPDGPFFLGERLSLADVLLMPMWDQFRYLLPHYRGVDLFDGSAPWNPRLQQWAAAVEELEQFKNCRLDKDLYIGGYSGYAGARGVAKFGE